MVDIRLQRMARVLVNYSLGIKKGDRLVINAEPQAIPLVREATREALRAGAFPELLIGVPGMQEILLKEGSDEQLAYIRPTLRMFIEEYEAHLSILSSENTKELNGVNPERIALAQSVMRDLNKTYLQRSADGSLHWNICMFPTNAYAQDAEMSLSDFEEFVYRACFLNEEDPVARWQELSRQQQKYIDWLKGKHTIHLRGQDTDLTLSIEGRSFINDD